MKKLVLASLLALVLPVACGEDSSNKPTAAKEPSPTVIRRSIPTNMHKKAHAKTAKGPRREASQFVHAKTACNIRGGPGTRYPIVRKAYKGEKLEYISREGNWFRLKVGKGKPQEWVHKSVVVMPKTPRGMGS